MDSIDPAFDGEDVEHGEEVLRVFLEARCEPSHVFHFAEEAFDDVAHGIKVGVVLCGIAGVTLCRNDAYSAFIGDLLPDLGAAISLIGDDRERRLLPVKKGKHHLTIVDIPARDGQAQGATLGVYSSVNFARATSA